VKERVYYQIQYTREDGDNVHSDGCLVPHNKELRKFFHDLLDEWLDKSGHDQKNHEEFLEEEHFMVMYCSCSHSQKEEKDEEASETV